MGLGEVIGAVVIIILLVGLIVWVAWSLCEDSPKLVLNMQGTLLILCGLLFVVTGALFLAYSFVIGTDILNMGRVFMYVSDIAC